MYSRTPPVESLTFRHFAMGVFTADSAVWAQLNNIGTAATSQAWVLANLALYVPLMVNETVTVYEAGIGTGATAGGNFDIGIYDSAGTKVVSSGTTARTASAWNIAALTDTELSPGLYYAAMSADTTALYSATVPLGGICEAMGICEQTSAFVLPGTATMTRTTRAYIPNIAFVVRSVSI